MRTAPQNHADRRCKRSSTRAAPFAFRSRSRYVICVSKSRRVFYVSLFFRVPPRVLRTRIASYFISSFCLRLSGHSPPKATHHSLKIWYHAFVGFLFVLPPQPRKAYSRDFLSYGRLRYLLHKPGTEELYNADVPDSASTRLLRFLIFYFHCKPCGLPASSRASNAVLGFSIAVRLIFSFEIPQSTH